MRTGDNRVGSVIERFRQDLAENYDEGEARAIVRTVFAERLGWDPGQMELKKFESMSESELLKVYLPLKRIVSGEPVQYVIGEVRFHGLRIQVNGSVLIPRPETEELVERIIDSCTTAPQRIIDIGTGSGCIALALKAAFPDADVMGVDVSEEALKTATTNARLNELIVEWRKLDVLDPTITFPPADLIVSNPPYVPRSEAPTIARHVLDHEPHKALFVPTSDPLLFYRVIGQKARASIVPGGPLWFEGHPATIHAAAVALRGQGWKKVEVLRDLSGKSRFISARS